MRIPRPRRLRDLPVRTRVAVAASAVAAVGASLIECDEPGEPKLIANPDPALWA